MPNPNKTDIVNIDLAKSSASVYRSFFGHILGEGDINCDTFGVRILHNGEPVSLSGCSCIGFFIRPDGATTVINGTISENVASVTVPEECYALPGCFSLAIKIGGTDFSGTMRIIDGTIVDTSTGSYIDPGTVIPDLADWIALISDAEAAAEDIGKIHIESELITGTRYKMIVYKDS